ncbi:hypothetical protein TCAL_14832 [Tigriopus californicus]|uniref:Uncharacterized protein n=1 Tax=Tigriopus californicus TaxID=6832 RepID=A0A553PPD0_TIGCA|nr:hypothetical protein TCAL_14832 [Tigriopus californicus]
MQEQHLPIIDKEKEERPIPIMKFLSLIAVVALAATVSADCETCKVGVNAILDYLGSNSEVTEEAAHRQGCLLPCSG